MTPQQIVGLFVRLAAIYMAYTSCNIFVIASVAADHLPGMQSLSWGLGAGALVLAALLWLFPMAVAHALIPKTRETNVILLPARQAAAVGSALLGLWAVVNVVPHLPLMLYRVFGSPYGPGMSLQAELPSITQIGIGVFLLCKPWYVAEKIFPADSKVNPGTPGQAAANVQTVESDHAAP